MRTRRACLLASGRVLTMLTLLLAAGSATADTWLSVSPDGTVGPGDKTAAQAPQVVVTSSRGDSLHVSVDMAGLQLADLKTEGGQFLMVACPDASLAGGIGQPALPVVRRLFVTPVGASVDFRVTEGPAAIIDPVGAGYFEPVVPMQAPISMSPGDLERATFKYDSAAYEVDGLLPVDRATVTELGVVRGQQLWLLEVRPMSYNPVRNTLALWSHIDVSLVFNGGRNLGSGPMAALNGVLLNPQPVKTFGRGSGNYLIVCADVFAGTAPMTQFVNAKTAQGYAVTLYSAAAGSTKETIKAYIQSLWGTSNAPDYLLLVGDSGTIPYWIGGGALTSETDSPYTCMDGAGDWYPDMAVGRFSVPSEARLQIVVDKTLYVEGGVYADPDYVQRATFVAATDSTCGDEGTHDWVIDTYMIPNSYLPNKQYMRTYGATLETLIDAIQAGTGYLVFFGHCGTTNWMGINLEQTAVRSLSNTNMYPVVSTFSCNSAKFSYPECIGETFLIYQNAGVAYSGATNFIYATTPPWVETSKLEWCLFDSIYLDNIREFGPAWAGGLMRFLAYYGPSNPVVRDYFEMFELLGDPSIPIPAPRGFELNADPDHQDLCSPPATQAVFTIDVQKNGDFTEPVTLVANGQPAGSTVDFSVNGLAPPFTSVMTIDDIGGGSPGSYNINVTGTAVGGMARSAEVLLSLTNAVPGAVTLTSPPNAAANVPQRPTFTWQPQAQAVEYDLEVATDSGFTNVVLSATVTGTSYTASNDLVAATLYHWHVRANNGCGDGSFGSPFTFTTVLLADYFTEQFTTMAFDLENFSVTFTPDGSDDYYVMCGSAITALPTDPAGGTNLTLSDDGSVLVTPASPVRLYGTSYNGFYVNANGNITFNFADGSSSESYSAHFARPRISAVFDDLNPSSVGTVSWKQTTNRVAVTWQNVPEYNAVGSNTFQIEMFFNGRIRISWLRVDSNDSVVGLSRGLGVPSGFVASNLSAAGPCPCPGDCNCDGAINWRDIDFFVAALTGQASWEALFAPGSPTCPFTQCDVNQDGTANWRDIDPLVSLMNTACP